MTKKIFRCFRCGMQLEIVVITTSRGKNVVDIGYGVKPCPHCLKMIDIKADLDKVTKLLKRTG